MKNLKVMPIAVLRFIPALARVHTLNGLDTLDLFGKSLLVELIGMVLSSQVCVERCISAIGRLWAEEEQN